MMGSAIFTEERPPRRVWLPGQEESSMESEAESWEELKGFSSGDQLEGAWLETLEGICPRGARGDRGRWEGGTVESLRTYGAGWDERGRERREGRYLRHQRPVAGDAGGDLEAAESGGAGGDYLSEMRTGREGGGRTWSCLDMASWKAWTKRDRNMSLASNRRALGFG